MRIVNIFKEVFSENYLDVAVRTQVLSTRLAYIWNVLSPNRLLFTAGHALGAGAATWCFVNLIGGRFRGLTRPCVTDG